jgi:hypothetical protein
VRSGRKAGKMRRRLWSGSRSLASIVVAALAVTGLAGCENLGEKAGEALTQQPSRTPHHHRPTGPTKQAARRFLHKTFLLYDHGESRRGCTFSESKPYLSVDRTCASNTQKIVAQFHAQGLTLMPKSITVNVQGTRGRATYKWVLNGRPASSSNYLCYDGHRWWITGDPKVGDRGL